MAIPLSVLLVEDDRNDAELVIEALRRYGFVSNCKRVDNLPSLKSALERQSWDVVISDYALGKFDGMAALAVFQKLNLDIPFICVSGAMGEELAAGVMKAGAHDFVLKDNLARLGPVIRRELQAAEQRRKSKEADHMAAHLAAIVEGSQDAISSKDLAGTVLSWNRAAERIYGYTAAEMIGRSISTIVPKDRRSELEKILKKVARGERIERLETVRQCKHGRSIEVSLTISPIMTADKKVVAASTIAHDITARKQRERERLKLIEELTDALSHVKTLSGLLPICAWCKKIRDDQGYWQQVETYIKQHAEVNFTHAICPECLEKVHPHKSAAQTRRPAQP